MKQISIPVRLGNRSHSIAIGENSVFGQILKNPAVKNPKATLFVVADLQLRTKTTFLIRALGKRCRGSIFLKVSESIKNISTLEKLYNAAAKAKLDRHSVIIATGGGVIGDVAGFFAATYLRGLKVIHIPTTLVAQVDSSIGGKTGINLSVGKNLVGAFHQPSGVIIYPPILKSLPDRQFRSGLAEVIKYGVIADPILFKRLEKNMPKILRRDPAELSWVIQRCCAIKANVVSRDEREITGLRAILNFGHTIGHGIENASRYSLLHGEAVALGMVAAMILSQKVLKLKSSDAQRIFNLINLAGLPVRMKKKISTQAILNAMKLDKKSSGGKARFVLARKIGSVQTGIEVSESLVQYAISCIR